jgi:hypothetical protein
MMGDHKFHEHDSIDPAVARRWKGSMDESSLGPPARELAAKLGYDLPSSTAPGPQVGT